MIDRRGLLGYSVVVIVVMLVLAVWAWLQLPADATVPILWGENGVPTTFAPKTIGLLLFPIATTVAAAIFWYLPQSDRRLKGRDRLPRRYIALWIGVIALFLVVDILSIRASLPTT